MLIYEMKCVLLLLRQVIKGEDLSSNVLSYFDSKEEFQEYKSNLFTMISINELLHSYNEGTSFSLDTFLKKGIVPGIYDQETRVPEVGFLSHGGTKSFYNNLIKALKMNDFSFDSYNYLNIYNDDMVVTIPPVWLYRLGQAMKKDRYERIYFYSKNKPERLRNKEDLIEYLRRIKTFMVEMSSNKNNKASIDFSAIEAKVNYELKDKKEIRIEDIMDLFKSKVPSDYRSKVSKYSLRNDFYLVRKAEQFSEVFYSEPIEIQEKFLNKWIMDRESSRLTNAEETQKYILLSSAKSSDYSETEELNKGQVIVGLFALYVNMLVASKFDMSNVSLSDFKLSTYMNEETQLRKIDKREKDREVALRKEMIGRLNSEAMAILDEISELDVMRDFELIEQKRARYVELLDIIENSGDTLSSVNSVGLVDDISEIAFDNDRIMSLINEATRNGRIYLDKERIVIELFNKDITEPVFRTTINVDKMLDFVESTNMTLEDFGTPTK